MTAYVTGGTGFVGSWLIEELVSRGQSVIGMARSREGCEFIESLGSRGVLGDMTAKESFARSLEGASIVYHAAATVDALQDCAAQEATTVSGTRNVLSAAIEAGVRRFVYISSAAVYPLAAWARGAVGEIDPPEPDRSHPYGWAKWHCERIVRRECERAGLEWLILRLGYLYGPRNRAMDQWYRPSLAGRRWPIIGRGDNVMALLYVQDTVRAIVEAGQRAAPSRFYNVAGNEGITQRQFIEALADGFGLPRPKRRVSVGTALAFAGLAEKVCGWLGKPAPCNRAMVRLMSVEQRVDCGAIRSDLGWEPKVPFAEGIARTFAWYHEQHESGVHQAGTGRSLDRESVLGPHASAEKGFSA